VEHQAKLSVLVHPYERLVPVTSGRRQLKEAARRPGSALVWQPRIPGHRETARFVESRPGGLALIIILPRVGDLESDPEVLDAVHRTRPRGLLPHHFGPRSRDMAEVLRCPPLDLAGDITDYLAWRGLSVDRDTTNVLRRIIDLSAKARTINDLTRAMYVSRRALGRRLATRGLPVPSHWLQMARLLRLSARLQNSDANIFTLAYELGYPDAFSVSNQMYRLIGHRPSQVRECFGWEWILEAWLRREAETGGLAPGARRRVLVDGSDEIRAMPSMTQAPNRKRRARGLSA